MKKKNRILLVLSVIYFLLVNTYTLWEYSNATFASILSLLLMLAFPVLAFVLLVQLVRIIIDKFKVRERIVNVIVLTFVLVTTYFFTGSIIDFDSFYGKDVLAAGREGVAGCHTSLRLKKHGRFICRQGCFGVSKFGGKYYVSNDSIFFSYTDKNNRLSMLGHLGIIKAVDKDGGEVVMYQHIGDTVAHDYFGIYSYDSSQVNKTPN